VCVCVHARVSVHACAYISVCVFEPVCAEVWLYRSPLISFTLFLPLTKHGWQHFYFSASVPYKERGHCLSKEQATLK
jgi:hypothetical protein